MAQKDSENIDNMVVSGRLLAKAIGVSERRVRQLAEEGILVRTQKRQI